MFLIGTGCMAWTSSSYDEDDEKYCKMAKKSLQNIIFPLAFCDTWFNICADKQRNGNDLCSA